MTREEYVNDALCALTSAYLQGSDLREIAESLWEAGERAGRRAALLEAAELAQRAAGLEDERTNACAGRAGELRRLAEGEE